MTAVSGENATDLAAAGMTRALNRKEQKTVCGSVLRQAEERIDTRKVKRSLTALRKAIQQPPLTPTDQERLTRLLDKLSALVLPQPAPN